MKQQKNKYMVRYSMAAAGGLLAISMTAGLIAGCNNPGSRSVWAMEQEDLSEGKNDEPEEDEPEEEGSEEENAGDPREDASDSRTVLSGVLINGDAPFEGTWYTNDAGFQLNIDVSYVGNPDEVFLRLMQDDTVLEEVTAERTEPEEDEEPKEDEEPEEGDKPEEGDESEEGDEPKEDEEPEEDKESEEAEDTGKAPETDVEDESGEDGKEDSGEEEDEEKEGEDSEEDSDPEPDPEPIPDPEPEPDPEPKQISASWTLTEGAQYIQAGYVEDHVETILYTGSAYILDTTAPEVSWELSENDEGRSLYLQCTDANDLPESDHISVMYSASRSEEMRDVTAAYELKAEAIPEDHTDRIPENSSGHAYKICFTEDGFYEVTGTFSDSAGNQVGTGSITFHMDRTCPEVLASQASYISGGHAASVISGNVHVSSDEISILVPIRDEGSGLGSAQVFMKPEGGSAYSVKIEEYNGESEAILSIPVTGEGTKSAGVRVTDMDGNVYLETIWLDPCMIDGGVPKINITEGDAEEENDIFREDLPLRISCSDEKGLIEYASVTVNGQLVWEDGYDESEEEYYDFMLRQKDYQGTVSVAVYARDYAGNESMLDKVYELDDLDPEITMTLSDDVPVNKAYYNTARTLTVKICDAHIDEDRIYVKNLEENLSPARAVWEDEESLVLTYKLKNDGIYGLSCDAFDLAGNESETSLSRFVIDTTKPQVKVSFNTAKGNAPYYMEGRTAYVECIDENMDWGSTVVSVRKDGAETGSEYSVKERQTTDRGGTFTLNFADEGRYVVSLTLMDMAGNESETYESEEFIIDLTAPELNLLHIRNGSSNNGEVDPAIQILDEYPAGESLSISLTKDGDKISLPAEQITEETRIRLEYEDFPEEKGMDGHYTLKAAVQDLAGNESEAEWSFTVNRYGSSYEFDDLIVKMSDDFYTNAYGDVIILEENADPLQEHRVILSSGSSVHLLTDGTDYKSYMTRDEEGWYHYRYVISADNYSADGNYNLNIYSADAAGNKMESSGTKVLSWFEDRTAPGITISGAENGENIKGTSADIEIRFSDEGGLKSAQISSGSTVNQTYDAQAIEEAGGIFCLKFEGRKGKQTVGVKVSDLAGNETVIDDYSFRLTGNDILSNMLGRSQDTEEEQQAEEDDEAPETSEKRSDNLPLILTGILSVMAAAAALTAIAVKTGRNKGK